jgi:MFS family permease
VLLVAVSQVKDPTVVIVVLIIQQLCYMPTWGLTSSIAMNHSPAEKFPQIRVFGSIGWVASGLFSIVAAWLFVNKSGASPVPLAIDGTSIPFLCGAGTGLVAALVALTLPNTPPPAKGQKASIVDALGLRSFSLMKDPNFAIFIIISTLVMIPFTIYWSYCSVFLKDQGFNYITVTMNWGQFVEMFAMLLVPLGLAKFGVKWTMVIGLLAGNFINEWLIKLYSTKAIVDGVEKTTYQWGPIWQITVASSAVLMLALILFFRVKTAKELAAPAKAA